MHEFTLISTIAAGFGLALVLGYLASRLRAPPLVGYLVAGILIGPATPGYVADMELTTELAEIGVMLMMFGVGLHFSIRDLMAVQRIAVPGAIVQIAAATGLATLIARSWGWDLGPSLVFGTALSVASTVVLLRALEARGALNTVNGQIAVGWLIVEDLFVVLVLVVLPAVAGLLGGSAAEGHGDVSVGRAIAVTLGKVAAFVALMLVVGRRVLPRVLWLVARTGSRELFTLAVISAAVGVAYASAELFSVSFALGAFFAGMMLRESALSHRAAEESLPLRDAFSVLFFVSVGMLFDPSVVVREPAKLLATVAIVMLGKTTAAVALVLALRYPINTALTVGAGLAQIGEFSFILAGLGVELELLPREGRSLILAAALISITLNPVMFAAIDPLVSWVRSSSARARALERSPDPLAELPATRGRPDAHGTRAPRRLRTGRPPDRRVTDRARRPLGRGGAAARGGGRPAGPPDPRGLGRCVGGGGAGPGPCGAGRHARDRAAGRGTGPAHGGDRPGTQPADRDRHPGAQRRGEGPVRAGRARAGLPG